MTKIKYPSKEELDALFHLDESSGKLYRKQKSGKLKEVTGKANNYLQVCINYQRYQVHNIVYIMYYGELPESGEVDHKDRNTLNNAPSNLRPSTLAQNRANKSSYCNNTSGYKGVSKHGNKWRVQVYLNNKRFDKYGFDTPEEANEYAISLRYQIHGEFARHD